MQAKRIVCPIDFSEASRAALDVASNLAREDGSKVFIVHVEEVSSATHPGLFGVGPLASPNLRDKLNATLPTATEVQFEHYLLIGDPVDRIVEFVKERDADLIVMGTHGITGVARLLMGSVAAGVIRRSPVPVLTLKATANALTETNAT